MRGLLLLLALALLVPAASAFHQPGDCAYDGAALLGSGYATLCLAHVNESAPPGAERTELNVAYLELFDQSALPTGGRAWVATLTDANQYAFTNANGAGHGTRVNSDTGAWAFQGPWPPLAGAGLGLGARQYEAYGFGGTEARAGVNGFVPGAQWFGLGVSVVQFHGANGSCTETVVLTAFAAGTPVTVPLVPARPCLAQVPTLPPVVQP